jgi:hypothetical protein
VREIAGFFAHFDGLPLLVPTGIIRKVKQLALACKLLQLLCIVLGRLEVSNRAQAQEALTMATDLNEILEQLKLERSILRDGGYGRSVRTPWKPTTLFRDSVTCLNFGEAVKKHPCDECLLWEWVPESGQQEDIPCHHIPLNAQGDTIATLEHADRERAERALLDWIDTTIRRLEEKLRGNPPSSAGT